MMVAMNEKSKNYISIIIHTVVCVICKWLYGDTGQK